MMSRVKAITKDIKITSQSNMLKWLESIPQGSDGGQSVYDEKLQLLQLDPGRCILFKGASYSPAITVRPVVEVWNPRAITIVEPEGRRSSELKSTESLISQNKLFVSAGLGAFAAHAAKRYHESATNHAVTWYQERVQAPGLAAVLSLESSQGASPLTSVQSVQGSQHAPPLAKLGTKKKLKAFLKDFDSQYLSLQQFLTCLGLESYLHSFQEGVLQDLVLLSTEDLAVRGIRRDHIVQIQNGINYLLDLSLVFAPVPNDA